MTFFSTVTAKKFNHNAHRFGTDDRAKANILGCHSSYYVGIRDEVKAWVSENYNTWNEEKPDWFTEHVKASIPKDMIAQ